MKKISDVIKEIVEKSNQDIKLSNGLTHNFHRIIKRIDCYINDRYFELNEDAIFWQINNPRITNTAKNLDLDTKDLRPEGQGEVNFVQSWILKMRFRKWVRDNKLALKLNDLAEGIATYGSHIWKLCDYEKGKEMEDVDLNNMYFDPRAKDIRDTPKVEKHFLTEWKLREKEDVWDKDAIEKVLAKRKDKENIFEEFEVNEFWGEFSPDEKKTKYYHAFVFGEGTDEIILWDEDVTKEDDPYYDFHLGKYRGTWLRQGVVQRLFAIQERINTLVNENATTTAIASLLLLRSNDANTAGANVLEQAMSGQIIQSADLQQIGIDNRFLNGFIQEMRMLELQADKLCHTPDIITGETMPSGTPFRGMAVMSNAAKSTFNFIRQSIGEKVGYICIEEILPSVVKGWNKGEIFDIAEEAEDIDMYNQFIAKKARMDKQMEAMAQGRTATEDELILAEQEAIENITDRKVTIEKGFFNFDYGITMNVTGESYDKSQQNDAYNNALQWVQANPAIIEVPLFKQYLENNGIPYFKMSKFAKQQLQMNNNPQPAMPQQMLQSMVDTAGA